MKSALKNYRTNRHSQAAQKRLKTNDAYLRHYLFKERLPWNLQLTQAEARFKRFVIRRKLTSLVLLAASISVILSIVFIRRLNIIDQPETRVHVQTDRDLGISGTTTFIHYDPGREDELDIQVDFVNGVRTQKGRGVLFVVPEHFQPAHSFESNPSVSRSSYTSEGNTYYQYELKEIGQKSFTDSFRGNVFGDNRQEINLNYEMTVGETSEDDINTRQTIYR